MKLQLIMPLSTKVLSTASRGTAGYQRSGKTEKQGAGVGVRAQGAFTTLLPIMAAVFTAYLVIGFAMPVLPLHVHQGLGFGTFVVGPVRGASSRRRESRFGRDSRSRRWMPQRITNWSWHEPRSKGGAKDMNKEPSGAQKMFGDFAPKLVDLTDNVLFGDMWERTELSKRDRSLVTVAALVALNRPEQLRFHLPNAVKNGVKEQELIETITHLAFYAGWPNAMSCMAVAKEIFKPQASAAPEKKG